LTFGFGYGPTANATFMGGLAAVNDQAQVAAVTTVVQVFREIGCALGAAIPSAVFENVLNARLRTRFAGDGRDKLIDDILDQVLRGTLPEGWWEGGVRDAFVDAFHGVWWMATLVMLLSVVGMAMMKSYRLREDFERDERDDE
jgi:hypothetical protein